GPYGGSAHAAEELGVRPDLETQRRVAEARGEILLRSPETGRQLEIDVQLDLARPAQVSLGEGGLDALPLLAGEHQHAPAVGSGAERRQSLRTADDGLQLVPAQVDRASQLPRPSPQPSAPG